MVGEDTKTGLKALGPGTFEQAGATERRAESRGGARREGYGRWKAAPPRGGGVKVGV